MALTSCVNLFLSFLIGKRKVFSEFSSSYNILFSVRMKEYYAQSQKSVRRTFVGPEARGNANSIWFSKFTYWNHSLKKTDFTLDQFLNLDQIIIVERSPIHCRLFNHIPGLSPLGGRSISLSQPKMFPDTAKCLLRGKSSLSGEPLM